MLLPRSRRLRRALLTHRRLLAAALLAVAAGVTVDAVAEGPQSGVPLLVAARDLPAGEVLDAADLTSVRVPEAAVPDGAVTRETLAAGGGALASPVRRGEAVTDARVAGRGLLTGAPAEAMAVPVPVSDPAAIALVRPGDTVRVLAGPSLDGLDGTGAEVVVREAVVLDVPAGGGGGLLGGDDGGGTMVLAVDDAGASGLAEALGRRSLLIALLP